MAVELANRIHACLESHRLPHQTRVHAPTRTLAEAANCSQVTLQHMIRAVLLRDAAGFLLAVLPANHLLDFQAIRHLSGRDLQPAAPDEITTVFSDCERGSVPPVGEPYQLDALVHDQIFGQETVCFEPGMHDRLICMTGEAFAYLHHDSLQGRIARPLAMLESRDVRDFTLPGHWKQAAVFQALHPHEDIRRTIETLDRLPVMPTMAQRLLTLRNNPDADIADLGEVIASDPSLTVQILRYARSSFFNFAGRVDTLEQAITRVLGFETVMNMALGLAISRTFHNPADGPLGLQAFWRHAAYSAALSQTLARHCGRKLGLKPGVAYLAGLLHNFGYLLAGHLFRAEFFLLNKVITANPHIPVVLIERRIFGVAHMEMGAWLMGAWDMPGEITAVLREHHNEMYAGEHDGYVSLVYLVDWLLRQRGLGDGIDGEVPQTILTRLGMDLDQVQAIADECLAERQGLEAMAKQMAA